jgi:hypothetical protein
VTARSGSRRWLATGAGLLVVGLSCLSASLSATTAAAERRKGAETREAGKQIAGWVERITLLPSRTLALAKLDTGAKTSSIHAEDIERFERGGRAFVRYTLVVKESKTAVHRLERESPVVRKVYIKDHDKQSDARPVVELEFCMNGRRHSARFSLVDRSAFLYSVLLGREFLAGAYVVDPETTFLTGASCGPETEAP